MKRTIISATLIASFGLISVLFGCGKNDGQQQPNPGYVPTNVPAIVPTPSIVPTQQCSAGFINTIKGCLPSDYRCGATAGWDSSTQTCVSAIGSGTPQQLHLQSHLTIVNQDQYAWLLEQQARANLGYTFCQKNSAFGTYACSYYAGDGLLDIIAPTSGGNSLYTVYISTGNGYYSIPFQMTYYPTGDNRGFTLQQYGGYQYTKIVAVQGTINDPSINIEVYYKDVLIARGRLAHY